MVNIPLGEDGPDMDLVEQYVNQDASVKGIWCVPKYSNPTGITYSDEVVRRFANLKPKAEDFRIFWDNAYCIHHIFDDIHDKIPSELLTLSNNRLSTSRHRIKGNKISSSWLCPTSNSKTPIVFIIYLMIFMIKFLIF